MDSKSDEQCWQPLLWRSALHANVCVSSLTPSITGLRKRHEPRQRAGQSASLWSRSGTSAEDLSFKEFRFYEGLKQTARRYVVKQVRVAIWQGSGEGEALALQTVPCREIEKQGCKWHQSTGKKVSDS